MDKPQMQAVEQARADARSASFAAQSLLCQLQAARTPGAEASRFDCRLRRMMDKAQGMKDAADKLASDLDTLYLY